MMSLACPKRVWQQPAAHWGVDEAQLRDIREQQMALKTLGLFPTKQSA